MRNFSDVPFMHTSSHHDFDFFIGTWHVALRRLRERLVDCDEWQEFDGRGATQLVLGGFGNVDDNVLHLPEGDYKAVTLRSFDAAKKLWAIWWLDARRPHQLDVPVVGSFENGVGTFFADDELGGVPIRVRFCWPETRSASPLWEQAFSADGGNNWAVNWTMRFTRSI
jgi:hypothetical protein